MNLSLSLLRLAMCDLGLQMTVRALDLAAERGLIQKSCWSQLSSAPESLSQAVTQNSVEA